jgi:microcin C transport system permease protein
MMSYIIRRLFLMIPTLFGILVINFIIVQFAPGGPVEQTIARIRGTAVDATARFAGGGGLDTMGQQQTSFESSDVHSKYRGAQGLDPELIKEIEKLYGFDKPPFERFVKMIGQYLTLDFGESFYRDRSVIDLIVDKLPVSISLGLWTTLLIYLISIPLGIAKAVRDGTPFDIWSSSAVVIGYAIPNFLFAILLIILFAGGSYLDWFPLRGIVSDNWSELPWYNQITDYFWHITLPVIAMVISGFASITILTKNSVLEEIHKQYVVTARAKGQSEKGILYRHVFRNAMLVLIAGFPTAIAHIFFTGSILIEVIFSLDGLGLLGFESAVNRDYPVVFGTLFIFTLIGLVLNLIGDILYVVIDPRIDFEARKT